MVTIIYWFFATVFGLVGMGIYFITVPLIGVVGASILATVAFLVLTPVTTNMVCDWLEEKYR